MLCFSDVTDICDLCIYQWQATAACPGLCITVIVPHPCHTIVSALHCGSFCSQGYRKVSSPFSFSISLTSTFIYTAGKVLEKKVVPTWSPGRRFRGGAQNVYKPERKQSNHFSSLHDTETDKCSVLFYNFTKFLSLDSEPGQSLLCWGCFSSHSVATCHCTHIVLFWAIANAEADKRSWVAVI